MRNDRPILAIFWIGLGLLVMGLSYKMGLGHFHTPGPGLMPFLLGALLLFPSFYILARSLLKKTETGKTIKEGPNRGTYQKISLVLASLLFFAIFLERLGYLIVTAVFFVVLFWSMGNRWRTVLIASTFAILATYFGFTCLGVKFPSGILKF